MTILHKLRLMYHTALYKRRLKRKPQHQIPKKHWCGSTDEYLALTEFDKDTMYWVFPNPIVPSKME